jgi:hypothetical protein
MLMDIAEPEETGPSWEFQGCRLMFSLHKSHDYENIGLDHYFGQCVEGRLG